MTLRYKALRPYLLARVDSCKLAECVSPLLWNHGLDPSSCPAGPLFTRFPTSKHGACIAMPERGSGSL